MSIFDIQDDIGLLPKDYHNADQLQDVVDAAEVDVLEAFTSDTDHQDESFELSADPPLYICLKGYNSNLTLMNALLKTRLKRVIADVVVWRINQWKKNPLVGGSSSSDKSSMSYKANANDLLPTSILKRLSAFDLRPPLWAIG
jgi:hypothetical protein